MGNEKLLSDNFSNPKTSRDKLQIEPLFKEMHGNIFNVAVCIIRVNISIFE